MTTLVTAASLGHDHELTPADRANIAKVAEYAKALGLHGVFIMSPRCPTCGALHAFTLQTDILATVDSEGVEVRDLLLHFARLVTMVAPRYTDEDLPASN